MSGRRAEKRWSGSGARSGGVRERERSGERTKLAVQISLKGDMLLVMLYKVYLVHVKNITSTGILIQNRPILFLKSDFRCLCLNRL